ncbi:macrocin O-methyltransferase, partial [Synechococcus sp. H55.10]
MNSTIIVTSADSKFFELVQGTILSIREKPQGYSVDIGFFDVGLTPEQLQWMSQYVDYIVEPIWNYEPPDSSNYPNYFKALLSRPFLPEYFPGYEVYIWIDADAWVQDWSAIESLIQGALLKGFSIVPQLLDTMLNPNPLSLTNFLYSLYLNSFPDLDYGIESDNLYIRPFLNVGVLSMTQRSVVIESWKKNVNQAILRGALNTFTDQVTVNKAIYKDLGVEHVSLLPIRCNWTVHSILPLWDPLRKLWVEPWYPYGPIGILHLTTSGVKQKTTHIVQTPEGSKVEASLRYPLGQMSPIKRYDYVSPGQRRIYLDYSFPLMTVVDPSSHPWPYLRKEIP